jgi:hypothetical protein
METKEFKLYTNDEKLTDKATGLFQALIEEMEGLPINIKNIKEGKPSFLERRKLRKMKKRGQ